MVVNPARAGMILIIVVVSAGGAGKPRASGDDPGPVVWVSAVTG